MDKLIQYINKHISLTAEEEGLLLSKLKRRTYLKGQYVSQSGDISKHYNFIESGKTRTFYLDDNGNEHIVAFGIENYWIGDLGSIISQTPADFNVQCLDKTTVIQIACNQLEQLYHDIPKLERYFRITVQNAYVNAQKRIVRNFSLSAQERYLLFLEEQAEIAQRVPQYMIASYLGITKEFLSHLRNQIAKDAKS